MDNIFIAILFDALSNYLSSEVQKVRDELTRLEKEGVTIARQMENVYIGPDRENWPPDVEYTKNRLNEKNWELRESGKYAVLVGLDRIADNLGFYSNMFLSKGDDSDSINR